MRATLLFNDRAGSAAAAHHIVDGLAAIGWTVVRRISPESVEEGALEAEGADADVVVVAGGDGTVTRVAKRLAGRSLPMAIVPMGTANNVARSLGIGIDPVTAVAGLERAATRRIDLGAFTIGGRRELFVEGFGLGIFAYVVGERASRKDKELRRAQGLLADELDDYVPVEIELSIDGHDHSGRYVMVAVMNLRSFGPALAIAPDARFDDGALDVVLLGPEAKPTLLAHLRHGAAGGDLVLPSFATITASEIRLRASGLWAHADDAPYELDSEVRLDVARAAVSVLVPRHHPSGSWH